MALAELPPDESDARKRELAWLDSALAQLRSSEMTDTLDNLSALLISGAYRELSAAQSENGYPSLAGFMRMMPELSKKKLGALVHNAEGLEESMIAFLANLAEDEPDRALALVGELSRGTISADFKARLATVAEEARLFQAQEAEENAHHHFNELNAVPSLAPELPDIFLGHKKTADAHPAPAPAVKPDVLEPTRSPRLRAHKRAYMNQEPGEDYLTRKE